MDLDRERAQFALWLAAWERETATYNDRAMAVLFGLVLLVGSVSWLFIQSGGHL